MAADLTKSTSAAVVTFGNFEFVILDNASTDGSVELLREWARRDQRIHLYESKKRLGLSGSSNAVVAKARAPIVARMDADDVAHPDRLMRQWNILEGQPDIALVGTLCNGIDASGREVRPRDRWRLVHRSLYIPFPHGSAMFRREVFDQVGGYDEAGWIRINLIGREAEGCVRSEDYNETCRQLEQLLLGLTTEDGQSLVQDVIRTTSDAESALSNPLPDLVVHWQDAAFASPLRIKGSSVQAEPVGKKSTGQHASEGFCVYKGERPWAADPVVLAKDLGRLITAALLCTDQAVASPPSQPESRIK